MPLRQSRADARRLVVLGSCGAWPEAGRACSGYLLEHDGYRVLVDLGYGTLPRLLELLGSDAAAGLDAVVVTHRHPDHMIDLHGLFRARSFSRADVPPLPVHAAAGVQERVKALQDGDGSEVDEIFDWHPLPSEAYRTGPFELLSRPVAHSVETVGVRLQSDRLTVAFTGDTGPTDALVELGRDADLFVVEATDQHQRDPSEQRETDTHLTARQAGLLATEASVRRLLLTHFWPGNDREQSRREAAETYDGELLVADEGLAIDLR